MAAFSAATMRGQCRHPLPERRGHAAAAQKFEKVTWSVDWNRHNAEDAVCTQLLGAPAHTDAEVMLNVFVNSLLQRVAGTNDAGVLEAIREDASVQEVLSRPSSIRTVEDRRIVLFFTFSLWRHFGTPDLRQMRCLEDIHGKNITIEQPNVTEVLLAVNKANESAGRGANNLPQDFGQATSGFSATYDVEDWAELPWYAKDWRIGRRLAEKGFCILKGSLSSDIRHEAVNEAMELRKTGGFKRTQGSVMLPYEILGGFFGEMGSAWTRELHGDPNEQALQQVEKHIIQLGTDLAHCSVAFSGLRLHGHMAGTADSRSKTLLHSGYTVATQCTIHRLHRQGKSCETRPRNPPHIAMPSFDYWDIEEILAEEQDVVIKSNQDIAGGGKLYPCTGTAKPRDLKEGAKVTVPYWLAEKFYRRNAVELDLPATFDEAIQETLQTDPAVCRLGDKSCHYFEVGMKLAFLVKNPKLQEILINAYLQRFFTLLSLSCSLGEANRSSFRKAVPSQFLQSLTGLEEDWWRGVREAETHYQRWHSSFSSYVTEASHVAEVPALKRARLGA
eukprot:s673_g18.t1